MTNNITDILNKLDPDTLNALSALVTQNVKEEAPKEMNPSDVAHELAVSKGYAPAKGRVYLTDKVIAAAQSTSEDGEPRIVDLTDRRAVTLFRSKSGDVAVQNYFKRN